MSTTKVALLATAAALYMAPAFAQKAQDTLRIAINNPFAVLSNYDLPVDESTNFTRDDIKFHNGDALDAGDIKATMDYAIDPIIAKATEDGNKEFDPAKRADIYAKAFDRINEMAYHFPLSSVPTVYVHSKDVAIKNNPFSAGQTFVSDYVWK